MTETRIVPGYGPVMSRADLQAERDMMKTIYDRAVDRVRQGDEVEDMLKAGVMNGLARTWKDPQQVPLRRPQRAVGASQQAGAKCGVRMSCPELRCVWDGDRPATRRGTNALPAVLEGSG